MLIEIPQVLDDDGVAQLRAVIDAGEWVDGNVTSGPQAALAKHNEQLAEALAGRARGRRSVLDALGRSPLFIRRRAAAQDLPAAVQPLRRRAGVRTSRRQCDAHPARQRVPRAQRPFGDAVPRRPDATTAASW
jgi:hypothetical protein